MKKGFSLLELMVVIGIIGILSAILLKTVSGSSDSARAAKCLANMHDLANACQAAALEDSDHDLPRAGSTEWHGMSMDMKDGLKQSYSEGKGWVSWASMGAYKNKPKSSQWNSSWIISTYEKDQEKRLYALTNGAIWRAISGNASSYRCPLHEKYAKKKGVSPVWSYVMNGYFGCKDQGESRCLTSLENRDRLLLFAELPFNTDLKEGNYKQTCSFSTGSGIELDPTLQYSKNEYIGFNHQAKRNWHAHVCFADGHVEKLLLPKSANLSSIRNLTEWLCEGKAISFDGTRYEEVK